MLIETTNYHAREGRAPDVLAQRRRATSIRLQLGLPPGRIFVKEEGAGPDVRWECVFQSREEYDRDMAARAASPAFDAARKAMHELVDRFERHLQTLVDN